MDNIEIIGDKIWLSGYVVADLSPAAPASIVEEFRQGLTAAEAGHWCPQCGCSCVPGGEEE